MSKRDTDTEIWSEDWFLHLTGQEMLFWFYIKDRCDHAGIWRPNFKLFEKMTGFRINKESFLSKTNDGEKNRIQVLDNGRWLLTGFVPFQYPTINTKNRFHASVMEQLRKNVSQELLMCYNLEVKLTSSRPQVDLNKEQRTKNEEEGGTGETKKEDTPQHPQPAQPAQPAKEEKWKAEIEEIISFFNSTCGGQYRSCTKEPAGIIAARLNEKYTVSAFKTVISFKYAQWIGDPKMKAFIRPSTLFRPTHFPEYLSEATMRAPKKQHTDTLKLGY